MHFTSLLAAVTAFTFAPALGFAQHDGPPDASPQPATPGDLASVLVGRPELTVFQRLLQTHPEVFAELPKDGCTIIVPNDYAFSKVGNWDNKLKNDIVAGLQYHVLTSRLETTSLIPGFHTYASTTLTDPNYTSVKGGQQILVSKQPDGHVIFVSGFAERGTIVVKDIPFDHGVIQIVDAVMRVPESLIAIARHGSHPELTDFLAVLDITNLTQEILVADHATFFVPHSTAFQGIANVIARITHDELKSLLRYHMVPNAVMHSWALRSGSSLVTAENNKTLRITRLGNSIFVNSAHLVHTDVLVSNGLVHIIDNVLNPEAEASPDATATTQGPVLGPTEGAVNGDALASNPGDNSAAVGAPSLVGIAVGAGLVGGLLVGA